MLFIESKFSNQAIDRARRLQLLEKLQEKGLIPLIRSTRLNCYELALLGPDRAAEMERALANWTESEDGDIYTRGDIFCFEDFVLYLIFNDEQDNLEGTRAGIVYEAGTTEPLKKLEAFCRNVRDAYETLRSASANAPSEDDAMAETDDGAIEWRSQEKGRGKDENQSWRIRFSSAGNGDSSLSVQEEVSSDQMRAAVVLEDAAARRFLRRVSEAHMDNRAAEFLAEEASEASDEALIGRLADAKLLRREVLVSCRKKGRPLFRLPSPDTLAMVTASNALCSECGVSIADEKIEDLIVPTESAAAMLEDVLWLTNRMRIVLRNLGIPENQMATENVHGESESRMIVTLNDELFLFVLREGDFTASNLRRVFDQQMETNASHLVIVAAGKIDEEARVRLREHAHRRTRSGNDLELILAEGVEAATAELQQSFERVAQKSLTRELAALDTSLGLSAGYLIATRFRLMQRAGALTDLAESAIGAIAGSLREI